MNNIMFPYRALSHNMARINSMNVIHIDTSWFNLAIHSTLLHIVKEDTKLINWLNDYFQMIFVHEIF